MLLSTKEISGYDLEAMDGEVGSARDFLFDDEQWVIRYLVADTGGWLPGRKVLLSPMSVRKADPEKETLMVALTQEQIEGAPSLETHKPVSRQHEASLHRHYGHPYYWVGAGIWGMTNTPDALRRESAPATTLATQEVDGDPNLRSVDEVTGYHIQARDDEVGHVETFLMDDETFTLRYLVVDTRNWLPGRKVIIPPAWVEEFDWAGGRAVVDLTRETIEGSPEYDPDVPLTRVYEERLFDYYGRPAYWI